MSEASEPTPTKASRKKEVAAKEQRKAGDGTYTVGTWGGREMYSCDAPLCQYDTEDELSMQHHVIQNHPAKAEPTLDANGEPVRVAQYDQFGNVTGYVEV